MRQGRSRIKDCSTLSCTVQVMIKAVDDANGCVKSRLILVLSSSTDGVTRVAVLWHNSSTVCYPVGEGDCFEMAVTETASRVKTTVWSCL
jgi:hypothetical protein